MSEYKQYQIAHYLLKTIFPYFVIQSKLWQEKYTDKSLRKCAENGTAIGNLLLIIFLIHEILSLA